MCRGSASFITFFVAFILMKGVGVAAALETVKVPSGQLVPFWLAPKATKDKRVSTIKPLRVEGFEVMKFPVTKSQYQDFLKQTPTWRKENSPHLFTDSYYLKNLSSKSDRTPITEVSWYAARAFCESKGMRLPKLLEWEYMAAASETKTDANKDEAFLRRILDWYGEPQSGQLKPVGSVYKNFYGIWDLHGLVWEWVEDFNSNFITGESREDESFNKSMFCGAGGLSGSDKENYAAYMRFAFRSSLKGNSSVWNLGFRCVK